MFSNARCPCPSAHPWGWGAGSPTGWDPSVGQATASPAASRLHLTQVSCPFLPTPSLKGQQHLFTSIERSAQALGLLSVSPSCLWLLSEQLRPFENAATSSRTPSHPPCPPAIAAPLTPLCPVQGTWHADGGRPRSREQGRRASRTPGAHPLFRPDLCRYFVVSWLATLHRQLINDGHAVSRGGNRLTSGRAPVTALLGAGLFLGRPGPPPLEQSS